MDLSTHIECVRERERVCLCEKWTNKHQKQLELGEILVKYFSISVNPHAKEKNEKERGKVKKMYSFSMGYMYNVLQRKG